MISKAIAATIAITLILIPVPASADRADRHDEQMAGLDLSQRSLLSTPRAAAPRAASAGDDFRVSVSGSPARFDQDRAEVIQLSDGSWWTVWDDDRHGSRKILGQRYSALGAPLGGNELLAGSDIGADYAEPRLGIDTLGRVYLAFRDRTNGLVYASRFTADGVVDRAPYRVNDTSFNSAAGPFDLTVFPDGQTALVWENYSALGSTIELRMYTPTGANLVGPLTVNTDGGSVSHWVPTLAHAPGSGFLTVWEDYRNGRADIYARQFTGGGSAVGADFPVVPAPDNSADQYSPRVVYSAKDKYVIGWVDRRVGQEIYVQRYDQTVGPVGDNQMISSGHALVVNRDLNLSVSSTNRLHVVWSASGADNSIQSLELDSGLAPTGLPEVLNLSALGQRWRPAARYGEANDFTLVWTELLGDDPDIALMLFDASGNRLLGGEAIANDDTQGAHSTAPHLVPLNNWWSLVTFVDRLSDHGDIFIRAINYVGDFALPIRRANQDIGDALQSEPHAAAIIDDKAIVVWNDGRTLGGFSGQRIFGRYCTLRGDFETDEFLISGSNSLAVKSSPRVALQADGSGLVAWLDRRDGTAQVYGRWLATDGGLDGEEFLMSQPGSDLSITILYVGCHTTDRFAVVWFDAGAATPIVRVRSYDAAHALSDSFSYTPSLFGVEIDELAADITPDNRLALFWIGEDNGVRKAFLTLQDLPGGSAGNEIEITDSESAEPTEPTVSVSNNGYVSLGWIDRRDGRRLAYYQLLDPGQAAIGANQPVSTTVPEFMEAPVTDAYRGRAWFVWSDPRAEGLNIYANPVVYLPTDVDDDPSALPAGYSLSQNYPNPFNPSTEIEYSIPSASNVRLTVFNPLGQTVTVLAEGVRSAGTHIVTWNGCDQSGDRVASGVYLYRLKAGEFSQTKKMLLLK